MTDPAGPDGGFTLIELLLVMAILAVVTVPLGNVVIDYFRDSTRTTLRLDESHDAQITNAFWQRDVASVGVRSATFPFPLQQSVDTAFPCTVPTGVSAPFVVLAWSEYSSTGAATSIAVGYAMKGPATLVRLRCTAGTLDSTTSLARNLAATPTVTCAGPGGSSCTGTDVNVPTSVTLSLDIHAPGNGDAHYVVQLVGQRRQTA